MDMMMLKKRASLLSVMIIFLAVFFSLKANADESSQTIDQNIFLNQLLSKSIVPIYHYKVLSVFPHDVSTFTEGLFLDKGILYESAGLFGQSSLSKINLKSAKILQKLPLPKQYFAEGIALLGNEVYQLTYQEGVGFVYDKTTFKLKRTFRYNTEGWGLTTDGKALIMSDGSATIRFLNPTTFKEIRRIVVHIQQRPINLINELEYIRGKIYANIWYTDLIAIISSKDGSVEGLINLQGLNPTRDKQNPNSVLNGIAYDDKKKIIYVTGKNWQYLYAIKIE